MKNKTSNNKTSLIRLYSQEFADKQRIAGKVVAGTLTLLENEVKNNTSKSLLELNKLAETYIYDNKCIPTFKNYKGFPAGVCISVNKKVLHGIPTDYKLQEGDIITFDLGATFEETIADSALTTLFGYPKSTTHVKLLNTCKLALFNAISAIKINNHLGCIGNAINKTAKKHSFGVINDYGGHGISIIDNKGNPHSPPFVANKSAENEGVVIQNGMTLAIEPIFTTGSTATKVDQTNNWDVYCDAEMSTHEEHTIFINEKGIEIMTFRENEPYLKNRFMSFEGK